MNQDAASASLASKLNFWMRATCVAAAVLLAACAGSDKPKPAELEALPAAATGMRPVWSQRLGAVDYSLRMMVVGANVYAASGDGTVYALDLASGREAWHASAKAKLSAGVGSDGQRVAVVTQDNELVVFDKGAEAWRTQLNSRVTTAPLVAGERVFVQGLDRAVLAFDGQTGQRLWTFQRPGDPLALNQQGVLQPVGNVLWAGVGSRLVAIDPANGTAKQDVVIGNPRGGNEVERLADLVGPAARDFSLLCTRAFQTAVGCVRTTTSSLAWSRPTSGTQGVALTSDYVVAADASDRLTAWRRGSGDVAWRSDRLMFRTLDTPAVIDDKVAFGDADGYIHVIAPDDGRTLRRLSTDGSGLMAPLVSSGKWLLAVTKSGEISAFKFD